MPFIHMLIYGNPGSEKTRTAGTSPNAIIMNCDGASGTDSIQDSDADIWDCDNIEDVREILEYAKHGNHSYEWLWLDGITLLQEKQMGALLKEIVEKQPSRDPDVPAIQDYMKVQNQLKELVRDLTTLKMHIGITAHPLRLDPEDAGGEDIGVEIWPAITGKLMPQKICGYMGMVGYMSKVKKKGEKGTRQVSRMRFSAGDNVYAKDRYGAFKQGLDEPSIPRIVKAVRSAHS